MAVYDYAETFMRELAQKYSKQIRTMRCHGLIGSTCTALVGTEV